MVIHSGHSQWSFTGGVLRLHRPDGSAVDIEPLLDRAVCFWSDSRTPHEVLPAHRPRWAVSAWYHHDEKEEEGASGDEVSLTLVLNK